MNEDDEQPKARRINRIIDELSAPRLCLACTSKQLDRDTWGSWTWAFGTCATCKHFGITVAQQDVADTVQVYAAHAAATAQVDLFEDR